MCAGFGVSITSEPPLARAEYAILLIYEFVFKFLNIIKRYGEGNTHCLLSFCLISKFGTFWKVVFPKLWNLPAGGNEGIPGKAPSQEAMHAFVGKWFDNSSATYVLYFTY